MLLPIISILPLLVSQVFSKRLMLTPKHDKVFIDFTELNAYLNTYDNSVEVLAEFDSQFTIYVSENDNFGEYKSFFEENYEMEYDSEVKVFGWKENNRYSDSQSVPWHLSRVVQTDLPLKGQFPYGSGKCHSNNKNINTYIIDTGIDVKHPEFEGRAVWLSNDSGDGEDRDCHSHGTHCAGLVGSKSYGACKDANLFAIKVLGCDGSGSITSVIKGVVTAYRDHSAKYSKDKTTHAVVSMSLGGGNSGMLTKAISACLKMNPHIHFTVAAGNENQDSCNVSPANAKGVITVMASDSKDSKASFSNWGKCANMYSPGVSILSTVPDGKTAVYSGTSMATPLLAGVLNHYIDMHTNVDNKQMVQILTASASKDKIHGNVDSTANLLVFLSRDKSSKQDEL